MVTTAIKGMGFTVLDARDGIHAVEVFRQHQDEICLVLCDLNMPRMGGWETLKALRLLAPDIPVILSSGYSEAQVMAGDHPDMPQVFLSKPCRLVELREAFSRVLDRKAERITSA
jgi:CheY-like chemotaxis protein